MEDNELYHYGVKGMKWGIRRTPAQLGHKTASKKKETSSEPGAVKKATKKVGEAISDKRAASKQKKAAEKEVKAQQKRRKKPISEMTDDELQSEISRLELEKRYRDLSPKQKSSGKDFVVDVLKASGKNIATQTATYVMGTAVNKAAERVFNDPNIINPKKGQKDK